MSYFAHLHLKNITKNRCIFQKCVNELQIRLYCKSYDKQDGKQSKGIKQILKDQKTKRKAFKIKLLQNLKRTKEKVEGIIERENIWTIPNFICIARIVTTPCLGYLIISQEYQIALYLLGFAGFSDLADGWIARTWTSQASKLGSFLDPVADKFLVGTLFLSLGWMGFIPMPLMYLVLARDVALIIGASYIRYHSLPPPKTFTRYFDPTHATVQLAPTFTSKLNTGVQLCFVAGTLAAPVFHFVDHPVLQGLCYLTAITTVAGGFSYLISNNTYKILRKQKT